MIRVGIIGSQSMHAAEFAKCCNLRDENGDFFIPDMRVDAICPIDDSKEHAQKVVAEAFIKKTVNAPEELFSCCDAVMVLTRNGKNHLSYAMPFINRGMPVFIDKPICARVDDAKELAEALKHSAAVVCGGSGVKHCSSVKKIKSMIDSDAFGKIHGISLNHNADILSTYGGISFYAPHAIEIMFTLFGTNYKSVCAAVLDRSNFSAYFKYDKKFANIIFTCGYSDYFVTLYTEEGNVNFKMNFSDIFTETMRNFYDCICGAKPTQTYEALLAHVYAINDLENAITGGIL